MSGLGDDTKIMSGSGMTRGWVWKLQLKGGKKRQEGERGGTVRGTAWGRRSVSGLGDDIKIVSRSGMTRGWVWKLQLKGGKKRQEGERGGTMRGTTWGSSGSTTGSRMVGVGVGVGEKAGNVGDRVRTARIARLRMREFHTMKDTNSGI